MIIVAAILHLLLAMTFARAAVHKLNDRQQFRAGLTAYNLLPTRLVPLAATMLASAEVIAALLLLQLSSAAGLLLAAALLMLYATAMAINLVRGNTQIDCGCGGPLAVKKTISWQLVLRNILLATLALCASAVTPSLALASNITTLLLILAGTASSLLLQEAIEQALANSQRYRHWLARQLVQTGTP